MIVHPPVPLRRCAQDDDVVPEAGVLDAYVAATSRFPSAALLVGLTRTPEPRSLMEHAMVGDTGRRLGGGGLRSLSERE